MNKYLEKELFEVILLFSQFSILMIFARINFNKQINIDFQNQIQNSVYNARDTKCVHVQCTLELKTITVC